MESSGIDRASTKLEELVDRIASIEGLSMKPAALAVDVRILASVYPKDFDEVADNLVAALKDVVTNRVNTSPMKHDYKDYRCYHFQSCIKQGHPADMRILFKPGEHGIEVLSFGNRHIPEDFYTFSAQRINPTDE